MVFDSAPTFVTGLVLRGAKKHFNEEHLSAVFNIVFPCSGLDESVSAPLTIVCEEGMEQWTEVIKRVIRHVGFIPYGPKEEMPDGNFPIVIIEAPTESMVPGTSMLNPHCRIELFTKGAILYAGNADTGREGLFTEEWLMNNT